MKISKCQYIAFIFGLVFSLSISGNNIQISESFNSAVGEVPGEVVGDGDTTLAVIQSHVYRLPRSYAVTLIVNDGKLDSDPVAITASVDLVPLKFVDLAVLFVTGSSTGATGGSISVSLSIINQGSLDARNVVVYFYLSEDTVYDKKDLGIGNRYVGVLNAGQSFTISQSVGIPSRMILADVPTYYLLAVVDRYNYVAEIDDPDTLTGNNIAIAPSTIDISIGADLELTAVAGPTAGVTGGTIDTRATVTNIGDGTTSGNTYIYYYLSTDAIFDSADRSLGMRNASYLGAGVTKEIAATFTVPTSLSAGEYYLLAVADRYNYVKEKDDPDNLAGNNLAVAISTVIISGQ